MPTVVVTLTEEQYPLILLDEDLKRLEKHAKVVKRPDLFRADDSALIKVLEETGAEILLTCWGAPKVTTKVLEKCPRFKYVAHAAGEIKWFIERAAIENGLLVTNWGNVTSQSTAEGALAMTLGLMRNYHRMTDLMRQGLYWELPVVDEGLIKQRVGLHGLGAIAQEYARFLEPFNCTISAYSPHCPDSVFEALGVKRAKSLEELYSSNRVISCHAANTPENFHIVNAKILALIEDGGYFINTGRGPVVDTEALIAELKTGRINAALDVYEEEPLPPDSPLRDMPNCMVIPHRAGPTPDRRRDMGAHAVDNVIRFIKGEKVDSVIDTRKYDLMT